MLIRADPQQNTLSMLSFPRDLVVPIYCNDQTTVVAHRPHQLARSRAAVPRGTLNTDREAHRRRRQLPHHGRLPRLQAAREQAARRLHGRRPPLHQHAGRPERLRDHRPRARLPEARRAAGARLRPLPPHRLRPLPQRAPAAVHRGAEGRLSTAVSLLDLPQLDRGRQGQHRDRLRRLRDVRAEPVRDRVVRRPRVQAPARASLPRRHPEPAAVRAVERRAHCGAATDIADRGRSVRASGRDAGARSRRRSRSARSQGRRRGRRSRRSQISDARPERDHGSRPRARHRRTSSRSPASRRSQLPAHDPRRRAEPELLQDARSTTTPCKRTRCRRPRS